MPRPERFEYWVDAISDALFAMSTSTADRAGFNAALSVSPLDGLMITRAAGSGQTSFRTRRFVTRSTERTFHLIVDFGKAWTLLSRGEPVSLRPGDLVLTDSAAVHGGVFPDDCNVINLCLPPQWVRRWVVEPDALVGKPIAGGVGWGAALSCFVGQLSPETVVATTVPHRHISDHLGTLLALVEQQRSGADMFSATALRIRRENIGRVVDVIRQRLGEEKLLAADVAAALNVDADSVHRWMADSGLAFGTLLQLERVSRASDMLSAPKHGHLSVSDIARNVGIHDLNQFAKAFRSYYGESPREHRRQARGRDDAIKLDRGQRFFSSR